MTSSHIITLPGLIDCHVHFREPGYTDKATMLSEASSARAGGVVTVCEMPNTNPSTTTIAALADKVQRAKKITDCDIRFFFGVTTSADLNELIMLWTSDDKEIQQLKHRCCGVKLYLDHSTGDQKVDANILDDVFAAAAKYSIPIIAHCEDPEINAAAKEYVKEQYGEDALQNDVSLHSLMRPAASESAAIEHAIALVRKHGTAFHVAHLSTQLGIELVRNAKKEGLPITCEVAPHHLFFTYEDYARLGTLVKMNPPLRSRKDQQALWDGIADGTVDCIATDHAPHTQQEKQNDNVLQAPSGVPGVETLLPLLLTVASGGWPHLHSQRPNIPVFKYSSIQTLCFTNPNTIFGLQINEHDVQVEIDVAAEWEIRAEALHSKCNWTPYEGMQVRGKLLRVIAQTE